MSEATSSGGSKIAVFDLDGTITYRDTYVDFLLFCFRKRPLRVLRGGELIVYLLMYKAGYRSNHWLKSKYLGTIAGGLGGAELEGICEEFCLNTVKRNFKPKALAELNSLKKRGYTLVLATASFGFYVERLYSELKMDHLLCSNAKLDSRGRLTGDIEGKNCIGSEKADRLQALCNTLSWDNISLAYSDDIVDLPLFEMADKAFLVDPAGKTAARAEQLGYPILNWRQESAQ